MRKQIYICDNCTKEIGDKKHISCTFGQYSGIALPPITLERNWKVVSTGIQGNFKHFCDEKCIGLFFKNLMNTCK
jgi:hypothetical protein